MLTFYLSSFAASFALIWQLNEQFLCSHKNYAVTQNGEIKYTFSVLEISVHASNVQNALY